MVSNPIFRKAWPHALALLAMLVVCVAYFSPQLEGKVVGASDTIAYIAMSNEVRTYAEETGRQSLWTNSMFGGMPTYQISGPERGNLLRFAERVAQLGIGRPIGYFLVLMVGMYVLLTTMGASAWLAVIGAVTFGLSANNLILYEAGHMTKLRAIGFMAPTLAGLILLFRGRYLGGFALLATALGLNIYANHPQMTYYLAAGCACFVIFRFIHDLGVRRLPRFGTALGLSLLAAGLALGASWSKISTTLEYGEDTMRGQAILAPDESAAPAGTASSSEVDGLAWDYAMMWSNGALDVVASFIPGVVGGSGAEPVKRSGPLSQALRRAGAQLPPGFKAPLYHGDLQSTSGPAYFGAINVFLFILAMFWLRPGWRYFLGSAVLVTLLLSMGVHAGWFNRPLFDYLPYFNNFRAPSSATSVTSVFVTAGAFSALCLAMRYRDGDPGRVPLSRFYAGAGVAAGLCLVFALIGPSLTDLAGGSDAQLQQAGFPLDAVREERGDFLRGSAWRSFGFVAVAAAALWAFLTRRLTATPALLIIGLASITDVWGVGKRYLGNEEFQPRSGMAQRNAPRPVDEQIMADKDLSYRVLDNTVSTYQDSRASMYHQSVGGYHAAKLQRYQDLIDRHLLPGNTSVLNMLNTRYVITEQNGQEQVQRNPNALGNAWLVENVEIVPTANAEIDALNAIDPETTAAVHREFEDRLSAKRFSGSGTVTLTSYAPDRLTYDFKSDADQLVVFSEIWYGPDKGWMVSIDGEPAELLRADYAFRAVEVPAGEHEIEMWFAPASFARGEAVSYASSGLIILVGLAAAFFGLTGRTPPGEVARHDRSRT